MKKENLKNNKGITLIALIITVIVMLILVGVTVATIADGGLLNKAKTAVEKTEEQAIHETILGAMVLDPNGKINIEKTVEAVEKIVVEQGKEVSDLEVIANSASFKIAASNGKTYMYKITETEIDKIANPWIERGLSPNFAFGKWYVDSAGNGVICLNEDGSLSQDRRDGIIHVKVTSEQIEQIISGGNIIFNGTEIISTNQLKFILNEDGTLSGYEYNSETGEYDIESVTGARAEQ